MESDSSVVVISFNAHSNCSEATARIHYNVFSSLKRAGMRASLISIIDTAFENTFLTNLAKSSNNEVYILKKDGVSARPIIKALSQFSPRFIITYLPILRFSIYLRFLKTIRCYSSCMKIIESSPLRPSDLLGRIRLTLPLIDKIFVYSPSTYMYLDDKLPYRRTRICLIPPPIDTAHFSRKNKDQSLRSLGLDEIGGKLIVGYVGPLDKRRINFAAVFKAISLIARKHDVVLLLVIPPYLGRTHRDIVNIYTNKLNLNGRVVLVEKFIDYSLRPQLYSSLDVVIHLYELREAHYPFLVTLEALSAETPLITTRYNEMLWVLGGIRYPLLVDLEKATDPFTLANMLERFIKMRENPSELRTTMRDVRIRLVRNFSLEAVGKLLKKYLTNSEE